MEIAPDSLIFLYSGIPLDPSYKNTLWFNTQVAQSNFFHSTTDPQQNTYLKAVFQRQYYTRVNRGQIKVKICADRIYDCNYLSFENLAYGSKWFYAFITSIEWVNNEVSLITFEIDVMQTYMFDATLKECFVEREHSATDAIGDNTIPENLSTGDEYIVSGSFGDYNFTPDATLVLMSEDLVGDAPPTVKKEAGIIIALEQYGDYNNTTPTITQQAVDKRGGEAIVNLLQVPHQMVSPDGLHLLSFELNTGGVSAIPVSFDGYTNVKNNKLFTSPYCYLYVSNNNGGAMTLKLELFSNPSQVYFKVYGAPLPEPEIVIMPQSYRGMTIDYENPLMIGNYPTIPFAGDVYKAYTASHKSADITKLTIDAIQTAATVLTSVATSGASTPLAVMSGVKFAADVGSTIAGYVQANAQPNNAKNLGNSEAYRVAHDRYRFDVYKVTIRHDYAEAIDDYFTKYGYATNKVKVPNRNVRPHFTYTKTSGCTIIGKMPADDIAKMQNIYDNGITFWTTASEVGNYSLNNAPVVNGV